MGKESPQKPKMNQRRDVIVVQSLLNLYGHRLVVDGITGSKTTTAIGAFQNGIGMPNPDLRVDRNGKTFKALLRDVAGGPLPPGRYRLVHREKHKTFGECIFLNPLVIDEIPGITEYRRRDGFFIHGRGDRGSDGCIVPYVPEERKRLNRAVADGGDVTLTVVDPFVPPSVYKDAISRARTA